MNPALQAGMNPALQAGMNPALQAGMQVQGVPSQLLPHHGYSAVGTYNMQVAQQMQAQHAGQKQVAMASSKQAVMTSSKQAPGGDLSGKIDARGLRAGSAVGMPRPHGKGVMRLSFDEVEEGDKP